jgi:transposase InsO family protein
MTYPPSQIGDHCFHLSLILDLYSRKIIGWEVHDSDGAEHAAQLARRNRLAGDIAAGRVVCLSSGTGTRARCGSTANFFAIDIRAR